jgi:methyl-accepting chemotaxis protein
MTTTIPKNQPQSSGLANWWRNRSIRTKLTIIFLAIGAIPVVVTTQVLTTISRERTLESLKTALDKDGRTFNTEFVVWTQTESENKARNLAQLIRATNLDVNNPANIRILEGLVRFANGPNPESNSNFQIVLNAQGKVAAAQVVELVVDPNNLKLPDLKQEVPPPVYRPVSALPTGTHLGDLPIIQAVRKFQRPLSGIELLKSDKMSLLGLAEQANVGTRPQPTESLPERLRPLPEGTFDIDQGRLGLVSMAVEPIKVGDRLVGMAVAGSVLNKNFGIVDNFSQSFNVSVATIFAYDWRVATNVPYTDNQTRAVGTRVAREVAESVLQKGEKFTGITNIVGKPYLTVYIPLFDHRKQIDEKSAKPIGISFVGQSLVEIEAKLQEEQLIGYGIGAGVLILVALIAVPIAGTLSNPLQKLALFTRQIGKGDLSARIMDAPRSDEIGILQNDLNQMAQQIETLVRDQESKAQSLEQARQEIDAIAKEQKRQKEELQRRALELLMTVDPVSRGDLTVRAPVTADEIGTLADSYNALIRSLRQIVGEVQSAAQAVNQTAAEKEVAVATVAENANKQAEAVLTALDQIQAIAESLQGVAQRAKQAAEQVQTTTKVVQAGDSAMERTVASISAIRETVAETAKKVKRLGEASQKISKVVNLISDFADQTNLLALNAAIEAARAGEEGRGFAVVAEEVRLLAQQSASASAEIEELVQEIQQQTNQVVAAMEAGTDQVVRGTQLVEESKQKLSQIAQASAEVNRLVQEIAQSAVEQTRTSEMVSKTMQAVAETVKDTSLESSAVAASFKELLAVAKQLQVSVSQFKL